MKHRIVGVGLAAGLALTVSAPMTQSSQAFVCPPPVVSAVCSVYGAVCRTIQPIVADKYYKLLCESFA